LKEFNLERHLSYNKRKGIIEDFDEYKEVPGEPYTFYYENFLKNMLKQDSIISQKSFQTKLKITLYNTFLLTHLTLLKYLLLILIFILGL